MLGVTKAILLRAFGSKDVLDAGKYNTLLTNSFVYLFDGALCDYMYSLIVFFFCSG